LKKAHHLVAALSHVFILEVIYAMLLMAETIISINGLSAKKAH